MVDYQNKALEGALGEFSMELIRYAKIALERQALKGHFIDLYREKENVNVINSRDEWGSNTGPKLVTVDKRRNIFGLKRGANTQEKNQPKAKKQKTLAADEDPQRNKGG